MQDVNTINEKIIAVLHDVVEDSNFTFYDLEQNGIPEQCIEALKLLTRDRDTPYMEYIQRISTNILARTVKLADLRDNSDLTRLKGYTPRDINRLKKYRIAIIFLESF